MQYGDDEVSKGGTVIKKKIKVGEITNGNIEIPYINLLKKVVDTFHRELRGGVFYSYSRKTKWGNQKKGKLQMKQTTIISMRTFFI